MSFRVIKYTFTEVTAETTANPPILLNNKVIIPYTIKQRVRLGGYNPAIKEYTKDKDLRQTATVTDYVTVSNPNNDKDWNDGSYASVTLAASTAETTLRIIDLGAVKTVYIYYKHYSPTSGVLSRLYVSQDGSTWSKIDEAESATRSGFCKSTCRYIRWTGTNSTSSSYYVYLYSIEIFDVNGSTHVTAGSGEAVIEHEIRTKNDIHLSILF